MSRAYGINDYIPNEVMAARLDELSHAVTEGPETVRRECTMRIPAELDRDADVVTGSRWLFHGLLWQTLIPESTPPSQPSGRTRTRPKRSVHGKKKPPEQ